MGLELNKLDQKSIEQEFMGKEMESSVKVSKITLEFTQVDGKKGSIELEYNEAIKLLYELKDKFEKIAFPIPYITPTTTPYVIPMVPYNPWVQWPYYYSESSS